MTSIDDELIETSDSVDNIAGSDIVEAEETVVDPFLDQTNGVLVMGGEEESLQMDEVSVEGAEPGAMVIYYIVLFSVFVGCTLSAQ